MGFSTSVLTALAAAAVIWYVVTSLLIFSYLQRRGEKVNFLLIRLMLPVYASRYRELTRKETGRVGGLFHHWIVSIILALVFVLLGVATRCC